MSVVAVEGVGDKGVDVVGKRIVVELREVDVLQRQVPSLPIRSDRRRPLGNGSSPRPVGQRVGGAAGAAPELGVDADNELENRLRGWLSNGAVSGDQRAEPAV